MPKFKTKTAAPTRKVKSMSLIAAITTILFYLIKQLWKIEVPSEVQGAVIVVASFLTGYYIRPAGNSEGVEMDRQSS